MDIGVLDYKTKEQVEVLYVENRVSKVERCRINFNE